MDHQRHPGDARSLVPAEQLLQLGGEDRPLAGVVDPDPRPARHLDPLRGDLLQAGAPRDQPEQGRGHVDALQVGAAADAGQLGLQPQVGGLDEEASSTGRQGSPSARWQNARRSRMAAASGGQRRTDRPSLRRPSRTAGLTPASRSGAEESSIAPRRSTRRAETSPCRCPGGTRQAISSPDPRSGAAATSAISSSITTACAIRAVADPAGRSATATASHSAAPSREPAGSSAAVPEAIR
nr:hypothetical protein GCM10020093_084960 [Planobispora longispora]